MGGGQLERDTEQKGGREREKTRRGGGGIGGWAQRKEKIEPISSSPYQMAQALFLQSGVSSPLNS